MSTSMPRTVRGNILFRMFYDPLIMGPIKCGFSIQTYTEKKVFEKLPYF